jgi:outer membrane lipoprotein-sorting protein
MKKLIAGILLLFPLLVSVNGQSAREVVKKADDKLRGEKSSRSVMQMKIVRPSYDRTIKFKSWSKGNELSMTLILSPANEKGQAYLKRGNEMWNWNPTINRMIKLPPSMLSQGWMGSDYTNEDILNESSIVVDYSHQFTGSATLEGYDCHIIELTPKEGAPVVWGKIKLWITKDLYLQMKAEYYDEEDYLMRTIKSSKVKTMDNRKIPTYSEIIPADEEGHKTLVEILEIEFNIDISNHFFSQQKMKNLR